MTLMRMEILREGERMQRKPDNLAMAKNIIVINDPRGRVSIALKESGRTLGARRGTLVLKGRREEYVIAEGFPEEEFPIGQKVSSRSVRHFLSQVLDRGLPIVVKNPVLRDDLASAREILISEATQAMLFAPLFHAGDPLGIVALESRRMYTQKFSKANYRKITATMQLVAAAVAREKANKERKEELLRRENICALGEYSAAIMHTLRNHFTEIGGTARRMKKLIVNGKTARSDEVARCADIIVEGTERLEKVFNNGLRFVKFSGQPARKTRQGLNAFLRDIASLPCPPDAPDDCRVRYILDKRLDNALVPFDRDMMHICITDLLAHAREAHAGRVKIQTKFEPLSHQAILTFSHTGDRIDPLTARYVFNPFMTSEGGSTSLSTVAAIVRAHGGEISLHPGLWTQFKICLPLR